MYWRERAIFVSTFTLVLFLAGATQVRASEFKVYPDKNYGPLTVNVSWAMSPFATSCLASGGWSGILPRTGIRYIPISVTTTFAIECFDENGVSIEKMSGTAEVTPLLAKPTLTFKANPLALPVGGGTTTLTWTVKDATKCLLEGVSGQQGKFYSEFVSATGGSMDFTVTAPSSSFSLGCSNDDGIHTASGDTLNQTVTVDSGRPFPPTMHFDASPNGFYAPGGETVLVWQVYDNGVYPPSTCRAVDWMDGGSKDLNRDGPLDLSGYHRSTPQSVTATRTFSIECTNRYGTARNTVQVVFADDQGNFPPPDVDPRKCGNKNIDIGEACDDGTASNGYCPAKCSSSCAVNDCGGGSGPPGPTPGPGPTPLAPPNPIAPPVPSGDSPSLIPCGRNIDNVNTSDIDETKPCTLCHIVLGGQGLVAWGLRIMSIIAITVIFAMGVLYILSAGNSSMMETAKGGMIASLIGFAVMLSAYLIVNVVLTILVDTASPDKPFLNLTATQGYFNFACDITSNVNGK